MFRLGARIYVSSLVEAERFYCGVFGFQMEYQGDATYVLVRVGDGHLALILACDAKSENGTHAAVGRDTGLVFTVPFHRRLLPTLVAGGAKVLGTREPPWGGMETIFVDPFGNEMSLFSVGG